MFQTGVFNQAMIRLDLALVVTIRTQENILTSNTHIITTMWTVKLGKSSKQPPKVVEWFVETRQRVVNNVVLESIGQCSLEWLVMEKHCSLSRVSNIWMMMMYLSFCFDENIFKNHVMRNCVEII